MAIPAEKKPMLVLGVRYAERKDDPPPGLKWHKVEKKETLGSIADDYGIQWRDLVLYNFHTIRGEEINWYLRKFVGAYKNNGKWYEFAGDEKPGYLLVPDRPAVTTRPPPKSVGGTRNGKATVDNKIEVAVVERLANGTNIEVSGKWLYVFSAQDGDGVDFKGVAPPPVLARGQEDEAKPTAKQPGSAFTLDFPGVFHITGRPDKLEYEILITAESPPSQDFVKAATGKAAPSTYQHDFGRKWYFLSDPTILAKAKDEQREKRVTHAYRNTRTVTIDLAPKGAAKRFYFLLSPVQLGPEAIKYAMGHPQGLTPLLKPNGAKQWDPTNPNGPDPYQFLGPTPDDVSKGVLVLPVIDPYQWAENIAEDVYGDAINQYVIWINGQHSQTVKELEKSTSWSIDEFHLAELLWIVKESHPDPEDIEDEISDKAAWKQKVEQWQKDLVQRNAELSASAHRALLGLMEWLDGPAHSIIEAAIMFDTTADSPQDAMDVAHGILHWSVCTQYMMALEPGIVYLRDILNRKRFIPYEAVTKHFKDLHKTSFITTISRTNEKGMKYAYQGVLMLVGLYEFVYDYKVPANSGRADFLLKLGEYQKQHRDNLIGLLNSAKIVPAELKPPGSLPPAPPGSAWGPGSAAFMAMMDLGDKWTTWIIDPEINIPRDKGRFLKLMSNIEEWFQKRGTLGKWANMGSSYALKGVAIAVSGYNLYQSITTARFDYQNSVSAVDWASNISGAVVAVQDVLAEVAVITGSTGLKRVFPSLMTTSGGPTWGVGAAQVTGIAGRVFAGVNVLAMAVAGVATMVSMYKGFSQAKARGDYTAAAFYAVGVVGGAMMVGGAIAFGIGLMQAGGAASATGIGATVGVVLFAVGGIIAGVAAFFGWASSSDDYEVFARKCFLGVHSGKEPRFGDDPPDWTNAASSGPKSWPIEKQKQALFNLLGKFKLKTKPDRAFTRNQMYLDTVQFDIVPGWFPPGSTVEVALHYGEKGSPTSAGIVWKHFEDGVMQYDAKGVVVDKGSLFKVADTQAHFTYKGENLGAITIWAYHLTYDGGKGSLVTTVTVKYPDAPNTIRCRKLVMEHGKMYGVTVDDDEVTSGIFK